MARSEAAVRRPSSFAEVQPAADVRTGGEPLTLSVVIPCLNEAQSIERCVRSARAVLHEHDLPGEVIVVDNGSDDGSADIATAAGARVVHEPRRGYGNAYLAGFAATRGDLVVMADADLTYDFNDIPRFVHELEAGADMVIGDRMGNIRPGAMPWLHRYVGNPLLTGVLNLFFRTGVRDAHCGMRALRRDVLPRLDLQAPGMEFASEMVIRAAKEGLDIRQIPIQYHPREGESKLSSFRDGWRHLRFLLLHSPTYLFLIPGAILTLVGVAAMIAVLAGVNVFGRTWDLHAMIGGVLLLVVGTQVLGLGACARSFAVYALGEDDPWIERVGRRLRLEHGLMLGVGLLIAGVALGTIVFVDWATEGFGELSQAKLALAAAALVIVGIQVFFYSFLLSLIAYRRVDAPSRG